MIDCKGKRKNKQSINKAKAIKHNYYLLSIKSNTNAYI